MASVIDFRAAAQQRGAEIRVVSGVTGPKRRWTEEDDDTLRIGWHDDISAEAIGKRLGRTEAAVRNRAGQLKLQRPTALEMWERDQVALKQLGWRHW